MSCLMKAESICYKIRNKNILTDIDLEIHGGKITSIIGPNGSGKTTLLKLLCRNIRASKGSVYLDGKNILHAGNRSFARMIAYLSQQNECPPDLSVKELVEYGRYSHRPWWRGFSKEDTQTVSWALERTGMSYFSERTLVSLSGGERQRAWIAMALAQKPRILLLDEPTTYLDICHQIEVLDLIRKLNIDEKISVVMVLHDINHAARFSDELVIIKNGKLFACGNPFDVINRENLRRAFHVETDVRYDGADRRPVFYPRTVYYYEEKNEWSSHVKN